MNRKITNFKIQEVKAPLTTSMNSTKYENPFSDMYVVVMSSSCCKAFNAISCKLQGFKQANILIVEQQFPTGDSRTTQGPKV